MIHNYCNTNIFIVILYEDSSIYELAVTKDIYESNNPKDSQKHTHLLHELSNITITEDIGASISVIESSPCSLLEDYGGKLFVRDFYDDLLAAIRNNKRSILVGNPGIGKSTFQFYYLARLLNPSKFKETLPPDWNKSTAAPKVVIRQIGDDKMIIYDIENRKALLVYSKLKKSKVLHQVF